MIVIVIGDWIQKETGLPTMYTRFRHLLMSSSAVLGLAFFFLVVFPHYEPILTRDSADVKIETTTKATKEKRGESNYLSFNLIWE